MGLSTSEKTRNERFGRVCYLFEEAYPILADLIKEDKEPKKTQNKLFKMMECVDEGLNIRNEIQWDLTD